MGQSSDSHRHASLDQQKVRSAGRQQDPGRQLGGKSNAGSQPESPPQAGGAFGKEGEASPRTSNLSKGGGGGGGAQSTDRTPPLDASSPRKPKRR